MAEGKFLPYMQWTHLKSSVASLRNFAIGFVGILYPPQFQKILAAAGDAFKDKCPRADDVWLHCLAIRHGFKIRQLRDDPVHPRAVPFTQEIALFETNQLANGNDVQISATYTEDDLKLLRVQR